ncbi:nuclease-related domain-containing DEAD/DEAH box helicase [Geoalkalibacter halelectricus]|uniref:nuclease-related domain-containing DEAD/DEAH box helicase n=1 Tax=Geoalkalibacter halelectricus TaxID=2847045 RepID=UPI00266F9BA1|nr:AAA family ATPase [Geoalkalibacter halelectricus]MDO3380538.1 AAA family ATPase [Geoalkalibacter halelectricus]
MAPGIWPRSQPRSTQSHAEHRVYAALKAQLPPGWSAWHSLRIRTTKGMEGEGDFVLAIPERGFLVLEVKGGQMEMRDGRWYQNGEPLEHAPREQALDYAKKLLARLKELGCPSVPFGVLTLFPDTSFSTAPGQDDLNSLTLGAQDVPWLIESIRAKLDQAFPEGYLLPKQNWQALLHRLWGETWVPKLKLGHRAKVDAEDRLMLDREQLRLINSLIGNRRLVIEGVAGSGKTLLAREAALRMAAEGRRVRLLCFTDALAKWLAESVKGSSVQVDTVPRYAASLLIQTGLIAALPADPATWAEISFRAAAEAPPRGDERPEVLIVDEAQDLAESEWLLIEELANGARTWIFHDPAQGFWNDRCLPGWLENWPSYRLYKSYRCPEPILEFSKKLAGAAYDTEVVEKGLADLVIGVVDCPSESSIPSKVENEIRKFCGQGFKPEDIAVLSLRGQTAGGFVTMDRIGSFPVVRADSPEIGSHVVADTFLRFKGLERPAVIVTDLGKVQNRFNLRVHIALTRALDAVRVVGIQMSSSDFKGWRLRG